MNIHAVSSTARQGLEAKPQSLKEAAEAFEALFIGQLLKSAREARGSSGLDGSDSSNNPLMEMADEHLAQQISKGGGCGFAKAILQQMDQAAVPQKRHSMGSLSSTSR